MNFIKMHGAGNDFVLIDHDRFTLPDDPQWYRDLADRHRGVGFDQLISYGVMTDGLGYRVYNSDGSAGGQCGNGARCVFRALFDEGRIERAATVLSPAGPVAGTILETGQVAVEMGAPRFSARSIPFLPGADDADLLNVDTGIKSTPTMSVVSMGNPHAVVQVDDVASWAVAEYGPQVQADSRFPEGVNVGFAEIVDRGHVRLRVYERGVGETLACGSGACAAAVVCIAKGLCDHTIRVSLPGGDLTVYWPTEGSVRMTGPTAYVFKGELIQ